MLFVGVFWRCFSKKAWWYWATFITVLGCRIHLFWAWISSWGCPYLNIALGSSYQECSWTITLPNCWALSLCDQALLLFCLFQLWHLLDVFSQVQLYKDKLTLCLLRKLAFDWVNLLLQAFYPQFVAFVINIQLFEFLLKLVVNFLCLLLLWL